MKQDRTEYLPGGNFCESWLVDIQQQNWPNEIIFLVWSTGDQVFYRITTHYVIEFHYMRTGVNELEWRNDGILISNIYQVFGEPYDYWMQRIAAFREQSLDLGDPPICLEFDSHLFANRKKHILSRDRDTGLLVVCRSVSVEVDDEWKHPVLGNNNGA